MIKCKVLNKEFATQKDMFNALVQNKSELISIKKSAIKYSDAIYLPIAGMAQKSGEETRPLQIGDTISAVINTTNYLDHHDDVHLPGIWNKSAQEQQGRTYHTANHSLAFGSLVGYPKDVSIELRDMSWRSLGKDFDGQTQALIFNTKVTDKMNPDVYKAYRDNEPVQHSIRMEYVNLVLAINDPDYKEEFAAYNKYIGEIANRDKAEKQGYFFAVTEAKISKEGATVLFGSNDATPYLGSYSPFTSEQPFSNTIPQPKSDNSNVKEWLDTINFIN